MGSENGGTKQERSFQGKMGTGKSSDVPIPIGKVGKQISELLTRAENNSGEFSFGGQAETLPAVPGLEVKGVGPISVPLCPEQAQKLVDKCDKSPFGRKLDTLMDENVRKSWQLAPDQVDIKNPLWHSGMDKFSDVIAGRLGCRGVPMQYKLYKLLVYGEGGHFVKHQDTEKEDGMVATLVVQLPSIHEGGDLVVYRGGKEVQRHAFGKKDGTAAYLPQFAVHYADAEHALEKVTSGYRLVLVYSICLPPTMRHLMKTIDDSLSEDVGAVINSMGEEDTFFALLLAHEYTEKSIEDLGLSALKGIDRARFQTLEDANKFTVSYKKLQFFIAKLNHNIDFWDDGGTWTEGQRDETMTWYSTSGKKLGDCTELTFRPNLLNPGQETFSELWANHGTSTFEGNLGNEGATRKTTYSRKFLRIFGVNTGDTVDSVAAFLRTFEWDDIGQALLGELSKMNENKSREWSNVEEINSLGMEIALRVADVLHQGAAQQALLKAAAEKASSLPNKYLSSSQDIGLLWKWAIQGSDKVIFDFVAAKFKMMEPNLLHSAIEAFSQHIGGLEASSEKFTMLKSIVEKRIEWLNDQLQSLGKPFSWEMPDACFPDNAQVQAFLRGPNTTLNTRGIIHFSRLDRARSYTYSCKRVNASFTMTEGGRGRDAFFVIKKTEDWFHKHQKDLVEYQAEVKLLSERFIDSIEGGARKRARLQ